MESLRRPTLDASSTRGSLPLALQKEGSRSSSPPTGRSLKKSPLESVFEYLVQHFRVFSSTLTADYCKQCEDRRRRIMKVRSSAAQSGPSLPPSLQIPKRKAKCRSSIRRRFVGEGLSVEDQRRRGGKEGKRKGRVGLLDNLLPCGELPMDVWYP